MNIYIGNLAYDTTEDGIRQAFEAYGEVSSVNIITDRDSGRPRGFGFVEMPDQEQATAAINGLGGRELDGRQLNVNEARPKRDGGGRGGGGGGRRSW